MNSKVDWILDVIDAGMQTPVPDPTFGEITEPDRGLCCRCQLTGTAADSDWCDGMPVFPVG